MASAIALTQHFKSLLPRPFHNQTATGLAIGGFAAYALVLSAIEAIAAVQLRLAGSPLLTGGASTDPLYESGTSLGFYAAMLFAANFVLATRWGWVENLLGGLERVYAMHGFIGRTVLVFVLLHTGVLAIQALPNASLVGQYLLPGADLAYTLGLVGSFGILVLVALTIWYRLPYASWLKSHKLMIVPFLGGTLHAIVLQADWYMMLIAAIGTIAWTYSVFIYPRGGVDAQLATTRTLGSITELTLRPRRPLEARPGQHVFLSWPGKPRNRHPFSISGIGNDGSLRLSVRRLGTFTQGLEHLPAGSNMVVHGPHGSFGGKGVAAGADQVWIAGGIGITPFLSMLEQTAPAGKKLDIIWSVRDAADAVYDTEIAARIARKPDASYTLHVSSTQGRLTAETILAGRNAETTEFYLCGPAAMIDDLDTQLRAAGVPGQHIHTERFALR